MNEIPWEDLSTDDRDELEVFMDEEDIPSLEPSDDEGLDSSLEEISGEEDMQAPSELKEFIWENDNLILMEGEFGEEEERGNREYINREVLEGGQD